MSVYRGEKDGKYLEQNLDSNLCIEGFSTADSRRAVSIADCIADFAMTFLHMNWGWEPSKRPTYP
jgi:hypothetical protein